MKFRNRLGEVLEFSKEEIDQMYLDMEDTQVLIIPERIEDNHYFLIHE